MSRRVWLSHILLNPPPQACTICFCDGPISDGILCGDDHYTCDTCFESYVRSEVEKPVGEIKKRDPEGRCLCPKNTKSGGNDRCKAPPLPDKDVAANLTYETFESYLRSRSNIKEAAVAEEMRMEMERRIELERKRAQDAVSNAGGAEKLRAAKEQLVEQILTLSCPRCHQAFVDFDGCFALNCGRCRAAFCAYCLADCGRDAHAHVGTCEEGKASLKESGSAQKRVGGHPPTVYGNKAMFEVAQKRRRCKQLALFLEKYDAEFRDDLLKACERELKDLQISSADIKKFGKQLDKGIEKANKAAARGRGGHAGRGGGAGPAGVADGRAAMGRALEMAAAMFGGEDGRVHVALRQLGGRRGGLAGVFGGAGVRGGPAAHGIPIHFDPLQDLLDAGIGGPAGNGLLPGENPEGVLGPLRRERAERKRLAAEAAERAAKEKRDARVARRAAAAHVPRPVVKVNLVNETRPTGGGAGVASGSGVGANPAKRPRRSSGRGFANNAYDRIAIDLSNSQDILEGASVGSPSRGRASLRSPQRGKKSPAKPAAGREEFVDLT